MPISQQGNVNTTSLIVPDLYVQIVAPQNLVLNGVPTNIIGTVGTACWGPVNEPAIVGTMADYARQFGSLVARKYDMGTQVATAVQQGAQISDACGSRMELMQPHIRRFRVLTPVSQRSTPVRSGTILQ